MTRMTIKDIADRAGYKPSSVRALRAQASKERREGTDTARSMPEPQGYNEAGQLWWHASDIEAWLEERETPVPRGGIKKDTLRKAIAHLEAGRIDAALTVMKDAL